jgi:hypothetical protein
LVAALAGTFLAECANSDDLCGVSANQNCFLSSANYYPAWHHEVRTIDLWNRSVKPDVALVATYTSSATSNRCLTASLQLVCTTCILKPSESSFSLDKDP